MIRIRTGATWRHDPRLAGPSGPRLARARAAALRAVVDALAIEVDGFDIAAGRLEGPLLPSLEALLRAIARVVSGAPQANVPFRDGELELLIRRRGTSALLTVVELGRTSRLLAHDVEVEVDALSAAALEASAALCRELAAAVPEAGPREARRLHAAERDLRRAEPPPRGGGPLEPDEPPVGRREGSSPGEHAAPAGRVACEVELHDEDGLLLAYEGGRPDLAALLAPGRLVLRAADRRAIAEYPGLPFLALRDLAAHGAGLLAALGAGEARFELPGSRAGRAGTVRVALDLVAGTATSPAGTFPCPPLALARALAEASIRFAREVRARNPRQAENAHLAELEAAAAERIAAVDELALADLASPGEPAARAPAAPALPRRPLGPGRLRRLAFRSLFRVDVGAPAPGGLALAGGLVLACGASGTAAVERASGRVVWRGGGATFAAALPGALLAVRDGALEALAMRTGRARWSRPLPGRFTRDGAGNLVSFDARPLNFARFDRQDIRTGFNFSRPFGRPNPVAPAAPGEAGGPRPGGLPMAGGGAVVIRGPGGGGPSGGGPGGGGMRMGGAGMQPGQGMFNLSLYHTWRLQDEIVIAEGLPLLDLLDGAATGSRGGTPRHEIQGHAGVFKNGMGAFMFGNWRASTRVDGGTGPDLDFSDQATISLNVFVDLGAQQGWVAKYPWLKGSRVNLGVQNLFDSRPEVTSAAGDVPLNYQPDYLDPMGRTVSLTFRKIIF